MNLNFDRPIEEMSEQELKAIFEEEWERSDLDVDLIKRVAAALEAKSGIIIVCDVGVAWQKFLTVWGDMDKSSKL